MQTGYFKSAWHDIKNSPGWFGKMLVLGLVSLIPVFGWIVVGGYLYGWARDIAWGIHAPLPAQVFGNEDGRLYSRGFFVIIIGLACALLPCAVEFVGSIVTGGLFAVGGHYRTSGFMSWPFGTLSSIFGLMFFALSLGASIVATFFAWIGSMRMSIYGRLSAGFQFEKIWSMLRHDFGGILRIWGVSLLLGILVGIVVTILFFLVVTVAVSVGAFATGGNMNVRHFDASILGLIMGFGALSIVLMLAAGFIVMVVLIGISALVTRAVGYWTLQFNVPAWRGQDDPMPFELTGMPGDSRGSEQSTYQPPSYQQPPR